MQASKGGSLGLSHVDTAVNERNVLLYANFCMLQA